MNNFLTSAESNRSFTESQIIAISKPPFGTSCPVGSTLKTTLSAALRDSNGALVFTPVPANQIDTNATGYVVARNGSTPSDKLWFFSVTSGAAGLVEVGPARGVTVSSYEIPPSASQPRGQSLIPAAPCTSGSIATAAIVWPRSFRIFATAGNSPTRMTSKSNGSNAA